jgi:hypothetical protein
MSLRLIALLALAAALAPVTGHAADRPVVVELFTSQGCSSCPPANAYVNELARDRSDVLALAFHVTYWDRLGWKDPFSMQVATERQDRYGHKFGDGSYTPEIVIDGASSHVGSRRDEVGPAIDAAKRQGRAATSVNIAKAGDQLTIDVADGSGNGKVLLVGFDRDHETAIRRGENGGRTLRESNVVRSLREVGDWQGKALHISEKLPDGEDAAVIVQAPDGRIVGAARLAGG